MQSQRLQSALAETAASSRNQTYALAVHSGSVQGNKVLKEAVQQVAGYCQERGVSLGCVCNGTQLVAFIAARNDGIAPLKGKAIGNCLEK